MSKKFLTIFIVLLTVLLWTVSCAVADQVIVIGQNGVYDLAGAMGAIRENAGNAVIYLTGNVNITQQAELPTGIKGLTSVTLASYTGAPVNVSMNGSVICANGVPFTLEMKDGDAVLIHTEHLHIHTSFVSSGIETVVLLTHTK